MLGDISSYSATKKSEGKQSILFYSIILFAKSQVYLAMHKYFNQLVRLQIKSNVGFCREG